MSDPYEEDDLPITIHRARVWAMGTGTHTKTGWRKRTDDCFYAGEGAGLGDWFSLTASESGQSEGGTEDDPVGTSRTNNSRRHFAYELCVPGRRRVG